MYNIIETDAGTWMVLAKAGDSLVRLSEVETHAEALAVRQMYLDNDKEEKILYDNGIDFM